MDSFAFGFIGEGLLGFHPEDAFGVHIWVVGDRFLVREPLRKNFFCSLSNDRLLFD